MRILTLSSTPWHTDNSFGNSYSNIFDTMDGVEFANIYCSYGNVNGKKVKRSFQITLQSVVRNLLHKEIPTGKEMPIGQGEERGEKETNLRAFASKRRYRIFHLGVEFIWKLGRWKSKQLDAFIDDYQPDLLFMPVYYSGYLNDILCYIKKRTNVPMIGYISDDNYTLRQFSLSPIFWIERLWKRTKVKKAIEQCDLLYVISEIQKKEYEKIFTPPCKVLTKCADFTDENKPAVKQPRDMIKLIYAGNVSPGRYKILAKLAQTVREINKEKQQMFLDIYTPTVLSDQQKVNLHIEGSSALYPPVSYDEIRQKQMDSDVLVHAEAFDLQEKLATHQSFSTKIVDYLASNRCMLAIGDESCSSIDYCIQNDCAVVCKSFDEILEKLKAIVKDRSLLQEYAEKGWQSGVRNHQRKNTQAGVYEEICKLIKDE